VNKIFVLGLGNILLRDEGVGVRVIETLESNFSFSPPIKIIDGGTLGFGLINELEGCDKLIVVDTVKAGEAPGTIYKFKRDDITFKIPQAISAHAIGFLEVLEQWKLLGIKHDIVFFGIEPKDISPWSMELCDVIKSKVPKLINLIIDELKNEGIKVDKKNQ
jgi:hydrogenase maturation protease